MKKIYILLAALAAMTLNAQNVLQGSINVGDYDEPQTTYNGSYFDMAPTNFYIAHTGAQLIYTPDELADMDGKTNIKVNKLSFKFYNETFEDITRDIKVYLQESDATEFAVVDGIKQFFEFGDPVLETEMTWEMLDIYGEDGDLILDLSNAPFTFNAGKSLIVTIVVDAQDDDNCTMGSDYAPFYTSGIRGKGMVYTNNWSSFVDYANGDDFPDATAMLGCGTNVELPVTKIDYTYEEVEEPQVYFLTGTFNNWGQNGNQNIEFTEDTDGFLVASTELEGNAEFKVLTVGDEGEAVWYGGVDENGAGYFLVTEELLGAGINIYAGDEYKNLRIEEAGNYNFTLSPALGKSPAGSLILSITKEEDTPTAVNDINVENIASVKYVNLAGQVSATPFEGLNIQVTTMKDGSKKAVKVIR